VFSEQEEREGAVLFESQEKEKAEEHIHPNSQGE
jgi:hypothetical protein